MKTKETNNLDLYDLIYSKIYAEYPPVGLNEPHPLDFPEEEYLTRLHETADKIADDMIRKGVLPEEYRHLVVEVLDDYINN